MEDRARRVVMVGQVPPPYHGQAIATGILFAHRFTRFEAARLPMRYSSETADVGRARPGKLGVLWRLARDAIRELRASGGAYLYYLPASPKWVPLVRDLLFLGLVRRHSLGAIYHFHAGGLVSFLRDRPLAAALARVAYGRPRLAIELYPQGSESMGRFLRAERVAICPNGLDVDVPECRTSGAGPFRLLYVGTLEESKGLLEMIETAAALHRAGRDFQMTLVGPWRSEKTRERARARVADAGLEGRISFPGLLVDAEKWGEYARADAFLFPTHYEAENLPLCLIEAMACGLPAIATRWRGIPHLIGEDGEVGTLVPPRDPGACARAILALMDDPARREAMGASARRRYAGEYTAARFCARVEAAIDAAIAPGDATGDAGTGTREGCGREPGEGPPGGSTRRATGWRRERSSRVLFAILDHRGPEALGRALDWWRGCGVADDDLLIVHGGREAPKSINGFDHFVQVRDPRLLTVDHQRERQSYCAVWRAVAGWMAGRPRSHVYLAEYDHLPLVPHLAARLLERLEAERADVLGHGLARIDGTSNPHGLYHESDGGLRRLLERISRREERGVVLTMLGTGSFWTRAAFQAVAAVEESSPVYLELWLPTVAHHLGFRVRPYGADQDRWVRHLGEFGELTGKARDEGAWTIHPVKGIPLPRDSAGIARSGWRISRPRHFKVPDRDQQGGAVERGTRRFAEPRPGRGRSEEGREA